MRLPINEEVTGNNWYNVTIKNVPVARYMPLKIAMTLVKAILTECYDEVGLDYTIEREKHISILEEEE